mgnify:CR=1 FL=1
MTPMRWVKKSVKEFVTPLFACAITLHTSNLRQKLMSSVFQYRNNDPPENIQYVYTNSSEAQLLVMIIRSGIWQWLFLAPTFFQLDEILKSLPHYFGGIQYKDSESIEFRSPQTLNKTSGMPDVSVHVIKETSSYASLETTKS